VEFGSGNAEFGSGNAEVGLRPVGAIGTYAPEGMWNVEIESGNGEIGKLNSALRGFEG